MAGWLGVSIAANAQADLRKDITASHHDYAATGTVMRHYDAVIDMYGAVIGMDPQNDQAYSDRCRVLAIVGRDLERALADCNQVLRLNPNNIQVFDNRGLTYLKRGEYALAIADFDTLLKHQPKKASSLYGRGFAKLKRGDTYGGERDIAAAKAIQTNIAGEYAIYGVQ